MKINYYLLLISTVLVLAGCAAHLQATGVDVHDPTHGIEATANSINSEVNIGD